MKELRRINYRWSFHNHPKRMPFLAGIRSMLLIYSESQVNIYAQKLLSDCLGSRLAGSLHMRSIIFKIEKVKWVSRFGR